MRALVGRPARPTRGACRTDDLARLPRARFPRRRCERQRAARAAAAALQRAARSPSARARASSRWAWSSPQRSPPAASRATHAARPVARLADHDSKLPRASLLRARVAELARARRRRRAGRPRSASGATSPPCSQSHSSMSTATGGDLTKHRQASREPMVMDIERAAASGRRACCAWSRSSARLAQRLRCEGGHHATELNSRALLSVDPPPPHRAAAPSARRSLSLAHGGAASAGRVPPARAAASAVLRMGAGLPSASSSGRPAMWRAGAVLAHGEDLAHGPATTRGWRRAACGGALLPPVTTTRAWRRARRSATSERQQRGAARVAAHGAAPAEGVGPRRRVEQQARRSPSAASARARDDLSGARRAVLVELRPEDAREPTWPKSSRSIGADTTGGERDVFAGRPLWTSNETMLKRVGSTRAIRIDRDGGGDAGGVEEGLLVTGRRARSRIAPMAPVALRRRSVRAPRGAAWPSALSNGSRANTLPSRRGLADRRRRRARARAL